MSPCESPLEFGPFRLLPRRRLLLKAEASVRLGSRALDILVALVERAGEVVDKNELISLVWPNIFVDEANLRVHIAALRKALSEGQDGTRYISNIAGRGYCFVAEVRRRSDMPEFEAIDVSRNLGDYARVPAYRPIGREAIVDTLAESLRQHRFLSIVGAAGVGKTTVALSVAKVLTSHFDGRVNVVDFAAISDPAQCPTVLATALGLTASSGGIADCVMAATENEQTLIIFDHCEHVADAVSDLAERMLKAAPGIHILAASREALRAEGERVHRLDPLETPPAGRRFTASEALFFPAVALFVERATACDDGFEFHGETVAIVAEICRRLDGNPLAIDVAAFQMNLFGLRELFTLIDDRLLLTARGQRTASARQQTLEAALNWSFDTLTAAEQAMLRRLSDFVDSFTMEAAIAAAPPGFDADRALEAVVNLVGKSLVTADATSQEAKYRLEWVTRVYVLEKLGMSGSGDIASPAIYVVSEGPSRSPGRLS